MVKKRSSEDGEHFYHVNGYERKFPSVTTILSRVLKTPAGIEIWKKNLRKKGIDPDIELQRRAEIGTLVHYRILNGLAIDDLELPNIPYKDWDDDYEDCIFLASCMFDDLVEEWDLGYPRWFETNLHHDQFKYAGQFDGLLPIDGKMTLIDLKTSKSAYPKHFVQLGGYAMALERMGYEIDQGMIITVHPFVEGNPKLKAYPFKVDHEQLTQYGEIFLEFASKFHYIYPELGFEGVPDYTCRHDVSRFHPKYLV